MENNHKRLSTDGNLCFHSALGHLSLQRSSLHVNPVNLQFALDIQEDDQASGSGSHHTLHRLKILPDLGLVFPDFFPQLFLALDPIRFEFQQGPGSLPPIKGIDPAGFDLTPDPITEMNFPPVKFCSCQLPESIPGLQPFQ